MLCLVIRDWSLSKVVNCLVWWWQVLNDEYIACWYSCGNSKQRESNVSTSMMNRLVVGSYMPTLSKETAMWTLTCYIVIDLMFCLLWLVSKTYFKPIQLKGSATPNFLNLQVVADVLRHVLEAWPDSIGLGGMQSTNMWPNMHLFCSLQAMPKNQVVGVWCLEYFRKASFSCSDWLIS
jgi:hypothetical protein